MQNNTVFDCTLITLPKLNTGSGNITVVNSYEQIPIKVKRVFYLYDIPGGVSRGAHAHKVCHQFLIAVSGSFEVMLDDSKVKRTVQLKQPYTGLHVPPGIWAAEINFSSGAVCLVLASEIYDENDYIRSYKEYVQWKTS